MRVRARTGRSRWQAARGGLTLLEVIIALTLAATLLGLVLQLGRYFASTFTSGERVLGEVREMGIILEKIRDDLDGFAINPARHDLGLTVTPDGVSFFHGPGKVVRSVAYGFDRGARALSRREGTGASTLIALGQVQSCTFSWGGLIRLKGGRIERRDIPAGDCRVVRLFLKIRVELASIGQDTQHVPLALETHIFPHWANRSLTSLWNKAQEP